MTEKWIDSGLSPKQAAAATSKMDIFDLDNSLGDTNLVDLTNEMNKYASSTNLIRAEQLKNNPWIEKLNREEPIYKTSSGSVLNMNLDHVIDVLREDLTAGRISPEQLNKVSIDQAIRRTQEYDIENARKMIQAKNAAREGMPVYKEYPEGFKWYELNRPGDFAAESQAMGHSVRGYEPPYGHADWVEGSGEMGSLGYGHGGWEGIKSGRAKVYSLVDPKGQSHVTVEVGKPYLNRGFRGEPNVPTGDEHTRLLEEYVQGQREGTIPSNITAAEYWRQKQGIAEPELPFEITQIKGKQNAAPNKEYLPFVQDFVTSSGMSVTRDLQNTGLRDISKMPQIQEYLKKKGIDTPRYIPEKQYLEYEDDFLMDQLYPPGQGMKAGGEVKMGVGGLLGKATKAAKAAKGAENVVVPAAPTIVIPSKISNVKEAIRESKGDFGARRVERAADEIPNLEKLYKEEALRQAFGGDNARAVMTMNPADFEKYAKGLSKRTKADIGPKMAELAKKGEIDKHTLTTDEYIQYLRGLTHGFDDVPFLSIDKEEFGLPLKPFISGHEGRHRSRALAESGQPTSLVRLFPSAELREPLPRRSQEEYIQALRDELELTGNLVLPEGRTGPAVVLPDIYAKGGEVKMGIGGLLGKGAIAPRLARAPAKTPQEIEAIAERMAPQVSGQYVRESEKSAKTVAGKTKKQFEREKTLPVDIRANKERRKIDPIDFEKFKENVVIGVPGDPTVTAKTLHGVGDVTLESAAPQHGGPLYGLYNDDANFWASGIGPATRVQNLALEAQQQYDMPVLGKYIMMGPDSSNYAQHFADANLQAIDLSRMSKAQIEKFNQLVRRGSIKSGPRPSFPGIEDKDSAYLHMAIDPELRKHFNALMQQPTVTEPLNMPSGIDIRFAITEPELRNLEIGSSGYSIGRMRPDIRPEGLKLSEHPTYSHDIPGQFMGGTKYPVPYELSFPDTVKAVRENPTQAPQEFGSLKMVGPRQVIDQQFIDEMKKYEEHMKKLTGKKKGGAVQTKSGLLKVKRKK
jgi:hypothetical protein